jgi:ribosomal protein S18 acetylase RimI-like enzyme
MMTRSSRPTVTNLAQSTTVSSDPLDNPIWHALSSVHAAFAEGNHLAKRYVADIAPLAAVREQSPAGYDALAALLRPKETAILFLDAPPPAHVRSLSMEQMICPAPPRLAADHETEPLSVDDVRAMQSLAELTEPGPFRARTIAFGGYRGIRDGGRLVAMAGQRVALPGYTEVSAVCTHPGYRGRGYAEALVTAVVRGIFERGETPFLGVRQDNVGAFRLYQKLGFTVRRTQYLAYVPYRK